MVGKSRSLKRCLAVTTPKYVTTLALIPDFLFASEFYSRVVGDPNIRFTLGVVTARHRSNRRDFPTRAYLLNSNADGELLTIWLYNWPLFSV